MATHSLCSPPVARWPPETSSRGRWRRSSIQWRAAACWRCPAYSRIVITNLRVADDAAGGFARDETKEIVVPTQKDLKRLVRSRIKKTGDAYTAARLQIL